MSSQRQWVEPDRHDLFWTHVDLGMTDGECWNWGGYVNPHGYGQWKRNLVAHRVAYELAVGPISEGLQIDHLCRNRQCVNPSHLEAVTQRENIRRGLGNGYGRKTHCPQGHPYDEANTYDGGHGRQCRICVRAAGRAYRAKRRVA